MWMRHVANISATSHCHKYEWVMSQIWMSYVTHMNASGHTHECVESYPKNELWHTHEKVMSHKQMTLVTVTQANNWRHTCRATHMHEQCQVRDKNIKTGPAANKNWCVISWFFNQDLTMQDLILFWLFDWCCFYYFGRNNLVALLEALCATVCAPCAVCIRCVD